MAVKVVFQKLCDGPQHRGQEIPASSLPPVKIGTKKPRVIELCDDCRAPYDALVELLDKYGHDPDEQTDEQPKRDKLQCPLCPYSIGTRKSLTNHTNTEHGKSLVEIETENGETVEGKPLTHGCDYCNLRFAGGQAKAQHEINDHPKERAAAAADEAPAPPVKVTKTAKRATTTRQAKAS